MVAILDRIRSVAEYMQNHDLQYYCITFSKVKGSSSATISFIAGCDNFRIEAIRSHEKSEYHRKSEEFTHARSFTSRMY
jgi:hypothetical protein